MTDVRLNGKRVRPELAEAVRQYLGDTALGPHLATLLERVREVTVQDVMDNAACTEDGRIRLPRGIPSLYAHKPDLAERLEAEIDRWSDSDDSEQRSRTEVIRVGEVIR